MIQMKQLRYSLIAGGLLMAAACHKDIAPAPTDTNVTQGVAAIVNDNFSLTLFGYAMTSLGYADTLSGSGPFTLIAPSNNGFKSAGYPDGAHVIKGDDSMSKIVPYCIIKGRIVLDSLPYGFGLPLTSAYKNLPLYITHWTNGRDTAITVNGSRINTYDKHAANGLVNISDSLLFPSLFSSVSDAVAGTPNLTFFNAALDKSGLAAQLASGGNYTIFAPQNAAFINWGIPTTDSIYNMNSDSLRLFLNAHIVKGRNFIYDYILKADTTTNTYTDTCLDGSLLPMTLVNDYTHPGRFSGLTLSQQGTGNPINVIKRNILAGNGVIHIISDVLTTNF
jgi:uncharacterized surface protein with fasciclin (FAS1) repeats